MANPEGVTGVSPEMNAARTAISKAWTDPANWDGDDYIGPGLPPWGQRARCTAVRNGRRCRKGTIPGGTVCNTHGGASPQVRRRAKLRVLQLLDPALGQLARIIANPDDQRTALAAIKLVAELNGMGKSAGDVSGDVAKALLMERHHALLEVVALGVLGVGAQRIEAAVLRAAGGVRGRRGVGGGVGHRWSFRGAGVLAGLGRESASAALQSAR
jgi:hypothetical protein